MSSTTDVAIDVGGAALPTAPVIARGAEPAGLLQPQLQISCAFESGNIEVIDATDPSNIRLAIRPDPYCEKDGRQHFQWFYFAVSGS